jgi:hypothetical protein
LVVASTSYSAGPQQDLLQHRVGDHVLDHDVRPALRVLEAVPRAAVDRLGAELLHRELVAPVAEAASVNFWMLPLCTRVTFVRLLSMAYW